MFIYLEISRTATFGNDRRAGEVLFCKLNSFGPVETKLYTFERSTVWTSEWSIGAPEYICIGKVGGGRRDVNFSSEWMFLSQTRF